MTADALLLLTAALAGGTAPFAAADLWHAHRRRRFVRRHVRRLIADADIEALVEATREDPLWRDFERTQR